jgi:hypothetical protein
MIEQDWLGPIKQARLLAHIAAGVRNNGHVNGPDGDKSVWMADHFIAADRWTAPRRVSLAEMKRAIKSMFAKKRR